MNLPPLPLNLPFLPGLYPTWDTTFSQGIGAGDLMATLSFLTFQVLQIEKDSPRSCRAPGLQGVLMGEAQKCFTWPCVSVEFAKGNYFKCKQWRWMALSTLTFPQAPHVGVALGIFGILLGKGELEIHLVWVCQICVCYLCHFQV